MALSYINNKEIKFGSSKPLNGVYTPGSPTREYEPLDSLGIYLNSGIPLSYGVENGRYMSMSDEFAATSQGNSYSFNQLFAAQMMLGFKLHDRFIACDTEHKIIGTEPLLHKAYLAEITEKTLDYFKIKIYGDKTRTFCIRMSSSEVPTSYVDLTNSFDENGLNLTQTDRLSFLSYYRFYPLTVRALSTRVVETLGKGCYFLPSSESLGELSGDILSKFNAFISSDGNTLTSLGDTAFAYMGDVVYAVNYGGKITESLLDTKVNYSDSLSYEEIMATNPVPDLTNKVASASALKTLDNKLQRAKRFYLNRNQTTLTYTLETNVSYLLINADGSLGVWILAQCGFNRFQGTIINGGWVGASFSLSGDTLTMSLTQTSGATFYYLIPLNTI